MMKLEQDTAPRLQSPAVNKIKQGGKTRTQLCCTKQGLVKFSKVFSLLERGFGDGI